MSPEDELNKSGPSESTPNSLNHLKCPLQRVDCSTASSVKDFSDALIKLSSTTLCVSNMRIV